MISPRLNDNIFEVELHTIKLWTNTKVRSGLSSMLADLDVVHEDLSAISRRLYVAAYQGDCRTFPCPIRPETNFD
jgi:hypothetical protein